jgi:hypothetical protein
MPAKKTSNRLEVLDHLRGFFIVVIIIDHMARWPSLLGLLTGKALLWITAAEGFVMISGLLVGYVRGYKNRLLSMKEVSIKLLKRALILYLSSIIATIIYTVIAWYITFEGGAPGTDIDKVQWVDLVTQTLALQYTFVWVHFLTLYALFLAVSPVAIWLLRRGNWLQVIALSVIALIIGWMTDNQALQWQALFFIPSVAGFYLEKIMAFWRNLSAKSRKILTSSVIAVTLTTILISVVFTFYASAFQSLADSVNNLFPKDSISLWRLIVAFLWFTGFILLFSLGRKWIAKYFGWLLLPLGTRSLSAYILHGVAIFTISFFVLPSDSIIINTLIGIACVLIVWLLLKLPIVKKVIPQ